jgi:Zn-dependent protease
MLSWPGTTPYDLRFRAFGIPVRVHPMFWLAAALLGGIGQSSVKEVAVWVGCVFLSILVHELGHGLTARLFGSPADIVLYWMGGLCRSEVDARYHPLQRIAMIFMGPGAGFLLAAVVLLGGMFAYGLGPGELLAVVGERMGLEIGEVGPGLVNLYRGYFRDQPAAMIFLCLVRINLLWGILNLLPIWPLDGGQIAGVVLGQASPSQGRHWTHALGLVTGGVLAFLSYQVTRDYFLTAFFALFAFQNYQILQLLRQQAVYGGLGDDGDWWRR